MTNEEIRIAIAKAKGYSIILSNDGRRMITSATGFTEIPNWPEDIAAAWELVEEMTRREHVCLDLNGIECECMVDNYSRTIWRTEETAPLAICAAWLAWKASA